MSITSSINPATLSPSLGITLETKSDLVNNYVVEIQKLVGQIFAQLAKISANDHESTERMKEKYMNATLESARLQMDSGKISRNLGVAAFTAFFVRLGFPNNDDKEILRVVSDQIPTLGGTWTASLQSSMSEWSGKAQLEMEKYRAKINTKSSEGSAKQDYTALLQAVMESIKNASRGS